MTPQGTLAEKLRCGGAGIPGFFTPTGVNTLVSDGGFPIRCKGELPEILSEPKLQKEFTFRGVKKNYVLEEAITGDFSIIRAKKVDWNGNCVFNLTARNFNPDVARAGRITIVEAEELVAPGQIHPDEVHLPGIYVNRIVQAHKDRIKPIEKLVTTESLKTAKVSGNKELIARRVSSMLKDGM